MKSNAYLEKRKAVVQAYVQASERVTQQLMADCMMLVLNEQFGFGFDRIKRALDALAEAYAYYNDALTGGTEADYAQEKLDEAIKRIMSGKAEFTPFEQRYPEIKVITYRKR